MSDFSNLTVIIPTLNEADNISKLISHLSGRYRGVRIIVADDGSTDGTKEAVERMAGSRNGRIRFLDRRNRHIHGLTASVLDAALMANTKKLVVMDGDMQHPFDKVGQISNALDSNELVIGVRSSVRDWGFHRRVISKCMSYFVYTVFILRGKRTSNDMMSGFFGIRTPIFKSLINNNKRAFVYNGYKVLLDILKIIGGKATIGEISYNTFHDRRVGESKLGMNQIINTLKSTLG